MRAYECVSRSNGEPKMKSPARISIRSFGFLALLLALLVAAAQTQTAPASSTAQSARKPLTAQQAINTRAISDLHFSPDGARVAMVVSEPPKGTTRIRHIWLLDVASHDLRQFTNSAKSEESPRWSPDGKRLAFLTDREEFQQIYMLSMDGGEALPLTEGKRSIQSFSWSPDGKQIAFLAPEPRTDAEVKKDADKDDARVADKDVHLTRLWLFDVATRKARQLTSGRWRIGEAVWLPDGSALIVSATQTPESDSNTNHIYSASVADGKLTEIAAPKGPFGQLRISQDGKTIAYVGSRVDGPSPHDLFVLPVAGGQAQNISADSIDRPVQAILWRPDSNLVAHVQDGFKAKLVFVSRNGAMKPFPPVPVNPRAFDISASGTLVFTGGTATEPDELWLQTGSAPAQRISKFNESWNDFALQKPEIIRYKAFDNLEIEGALLKPANAQPGVKLPLIVLVHGGPTGAWSDSIETWGQLLVAHGFAVFYPNIRGSTGYGHRFIEMNKNDWGGADFRDVMAGVDYLIAQGVADPDKLGIGGWSYGGYMSEWAITQTQRFKAAVSGAGLSNLASEFGTEAGSSYDEWFFSTPYENLDGFMKSSPVKYLKNAHTPTLILQGDADTTDPIGQSEELYRGLKHYGVEAEMVIYPREPHGLREEKHLVDRLNRIVTWYEAHLK
jgi:dipeptidyl aminopeptidase/acylaminoacyl peptidase